MQTVSFSDPRVQATLRARRTIVLATVNPDGAPLATPMWFTHDASGLDMVSVAGLRKVKNLTADPRLSLTAEPEPPADFLCVIIQGRAHFSDSPAERARVGAAFVDRYGATIETRWNGRVVPPSRSLFRIEPQQVRLA